MSVLSVKESWREKECNVLNLILWKMFPIAMSETLSDDDWETETEWETDEDTGADEEEMEGNHEVSLFR